MKYIFFFTILLFSTTTNAQSVVENGKIELDFKKAKTIAKFQANTTIIVKSKELKTIFVKVNMASLTNDKELVDVNKFALIDGKSKSRIKLIDASYQVATAYVGFDKLVTKKSNSGKRGGFFYNFDPNIKDTFFNFNMAGYQNITLPINFGTKRKPNSQVIHYKSKKFKKKKLILFFPFLRKSNDAILYYGNTRIKNFSVK